MSGVRSLAVTGAAVVALVGFAAVGVAEPQSVTGGPPAEARQAPQIMAQVPPPKPPVAAPKPAAQPSAAQTSDAAIVLSVIRLTFAAVHQSNTTGNYTVLRDLGTPGFRDKNSAADLTRIFEPIRNAKIDLGAVMMLDPNLSKAELVQQKLLHLAGALATKPVPVTFELLFQPIDGAWRIDGIAIFPVQQAAAPAPAPATAVPVPAAKPAPKPATR